jgi:hypothetical protein
MLVECKYTHPGKEWVFLPGLGKRMFAPYGPGKALRVVDEFSTVAVGLDCATWLDQELPQCYKGLEVDPKSGQVHAEDLRHGVEQLRYLLPRLLCEHILYAMTAHRENAPFVLCPILLTTAPLRVVDGRVSIEQVTQAHSLQELGTPAPYLLLYSDYGPDFAAHCTAACKHLGTLPRMTLDVPDPEAQQQGPCEGTSSEFERVDEICSGLALADSSVLSRYFTQFVVCNYDSFPLLVDKVIGTTKQILGVAQAR